MLIRRCAVVWLEPRELASFVLDDLLVGGTGVVSRLAWFAHAPHLQSPVEIDAAHVPALGMLSAVDWIERSAVDDLLGIEATAALLDLGVLVTQGDEQAQIDDQAFRRLGWHPPAVVAHLAARWQGSQRCSRRAASHGSSSNHCRR